MNAPDQDTQGLLTEQEARIRTELYLRQRINYQENFYRQRIEEFRFNSDRMVWISALLMGASTIVSSASVTTESVWPAFIAALLPAFAGVVTAFRSLYQWERQLSVYEQTLLALQQARLAMPDESFMQPGAYTRFFPELVGQTEEVLRNEASQWGQLESIIPTQRKPDSPLAKTLSGDSPSPGLNRS
jgi:hypothetical protein